MKVLGIGLGRTGTQSLAAALGMLGYRTKHCPGFYLDASGHLRICPEDVASYDALTDETTIPIYKEVDRQYPGSKFIITVREMESWLTSIWNNANALRDRRAQLPAVPVLHRVLYGSAVFDRQTYAEAHRRHIYSVHEYFASRPRDLLVMNICAGDGWDKLCPFLHKPIPDRSFPSLNVFGVSDLATLQRDGEIPPPP